VKILACVSLILLVAWGAFGAEAFVNPSFEEGMTGWLIQHPENVKAPSGIVTPGVKSRHALRIVSNNPFAPISLSQHVKLPNTARYNLLSFDCRLSNPLFERHIRLSASYRDAKGRTLGNLTGDGWSIRNGMELYLVDVEPKRAWIRRTYAVAAPKDAQEVTITLQIRWGEGTLWVDNFQLVAAPQQRQPEKLFYYNPFVVGLSKPPYLRLQKLVADGSPFLASADRFHHVMVAQSNAQELLERLQRARFYTGEAPDNALDAKNKGILRRLEDLYGIYGRLFIARQGDRLAREFDKPVETLGNETAKYSADLLDALVRKATEAGLDANRTRALERELPPKPLVIDANGKPNQLVFGMHSKPEHFEMERVLGDIRRVRWIGNAGYRRSADHKTIVFPTIDETIREWSGRGVEYFNVVLPFDAAGRSIVAPDFFEQNWSDGDIYMQRKFMPPKIEPKPAWTMTAFNKFNPAVVEATRQAAAQFAEGLKSFKKIYIFTWEGSGPCVGGRLGGYGPAGRKAFQAYLEKKFGTVENLNRILKTRHASFAEIQQPLDKRSIQGFGPSRKPIPVCRPLGYEYECWTQQAYVNYCRTVYQAIKERDPAAIVLSDHNGTFGKLAFDPMSVFEYADMAGGHCYPYVSDIYRSLLKYAPNKTLGVFEDQWAMRENVEWGPHRPGEEKPWRNYLIKHAGQLANQDYVFDSWWYSYTRGAFILIYGSPHWANPAYDLTTFRYFVTGVPTGIKMVRRIEDVLLTTRKVPSRAVMLIPTTSMRHGYSGGNSKYELRSIHRLLYPRNYTFDSVTEKLLLSGKAGLSDFDILITPFAPYFPKGLWDIVTPWIKGGGILVSVGPAGLYDEHGFGYPDNPVKPLMKNDFPLSRFNYNSYGFGRTDWKWDNGDPIREASLGKGKIVLTALPTLGLSQDNKLLARFLGVFRAAKREARSADTPAELTLRRNAADKRCYLFALNPSGDAPLKGSAEVIGQYEGIKDLSIAGGFPAKSIYDEKTGYTSFRFTLAPGGFTMYSLGKRLR